LLDLHPSLTVLIAKQKEKATVVQWKRISEQRPCETDYLKMHLYRDVGGNYGVGVYETDDYFFDPRNGEVKAVWWAEFNLIDEALIRNVG